jgi:hypothetical protein
LPDDEAYNTYGAARFSNISDWRRNNVDTLIQTLSDSIHSEKSYVKFGISPFGIWRNKSQDAEGSESSGFDGYGKLYADARKWTQAGWVDYINPQLYFPFFYKVAPYEKLLDWWSNNTYGKHLYIGQAAYRATENREGWRNRQQIPDQIRYLRTNARVQGSVFFSSKSLTNNLAGVNDSLRNDFYQYKALQPAMLWLDDVDPNPPKEVMAKALTDCVDIRWKTPSPAADGQTAYGYVIYRFSEGEEIRTSEARNILKISFDASQTSFADYSVSPGNRYTYVVTAIDRLKNESINSEKVGVQTGISSSPVSSAPAGGN